MKNIYCLILFFYLTGSYGSTKNLPCNLKPTTQELPQYAKGFIIEKKGGYTILTLKNSSPNSEKIYRYILLPKGHKVPSDKEHMTIVRTPVHRIIATSTTHIAFLEELNALKNLVGFPQTKYISSIHAKKRVQQQKIIDVGINSQLNIERIIELQPELILSFSVENEGASERFNALGIPTIFIGEWNEQSPLGRAEWIKVFGALLGKEKEANTFFETIEKDYINAKKLASEIKQKPTVIAGAVYQNAWYLPGGKSYLAEFFRDANATYIWADNNQTGSQALSIEVVLNKGQNANYWFAPAQHTSYTVLMKEHSLYPKFRAFKDKRIFTYAKTVENSNGVSFFESGTCHPELILKDLIHYLHPEINSTHTPTYFFPLND